MRTLLAVFVTTTLLAAAAAAQDSPIVVEQPWARAATTANGAAYLVLENRGTEPDRLVGVADRGRALGRAAQLQRGRQGRGLDAPRTGRRAAARRPLALAPGGLHIMLVGLAQPLKAGEHFPLTLTFEKAGAVTVDVPVEARPPAAHAHEEPMKMGN